MSPKHTPEGRTDTIHARRLASQSSQQLTVVGVDLVGEPPALDDGLLIDDSARAEFAGYELRELLGRGGMGEVLLAHDELIGRDVAIKRMRRADPTPEAETRFLREAKIQARLQHPSIVPVHELGRDADGRPYFTMKRLAGVTLEELRGEPLKRLLRAFADVCLAIEFAHEHGVIHRDIKPTNIMLGDFGEVYVLDWGVALVQGDGSHNPSVRDIAQAEGETAVGSVMGTPGYMAPEQALGYATTPAIDIYALGCVLFEILACEPLHPRGTGGAANAIAHPTEAPSARRPDLAIPPELDAACVAALAEEPRERPSARELAQRVQDYLDGDRDLERRRELAAAQVVRAREALASGDPAQRADAVHTAGRALALDPESTDAANLVAGLIVEPPRVFPPALVASLEDADRAAHRLRARTAMYAFTAVLLLAGVVPFVEVRSWPLLIGFFGATAALAWISWMSSRHGIPMVTIGLVMTFVTTLFASRVASPFVLTPVIACGMVLGLTAIPWILLRPWVIAAWIAMAMIVPVVLEEIGWFAPTWWFESGSIRIQSAVFEGTSWTFGAVGLVGAHFVFLAAAARFSGVTSRDRSSAERRLHIQTWHLRQLLPSQAITLPPIRRSGRAGAIASVLPSDSHGSRSP